MVGGPAGAGDPRLSAAGPGSSAYRSELTISYGSSEPADPVRIPSPPGYQGPSIAELLRAAVLPAIEATLRPGEIDALDLHWESGLGRPGRPIPAADEPVLVLDVVCVGEPFRFYVTFGSNDDGSVEEIGQRLRSDLQDLVAESRFGWGQQR